MKILLAKLAATFAFLVWFLGLGLSWSLSAMGVPHGLAAAVWRMGLFVWVLTFWMARRRPAVTPPDDGPLAPPRETLGMSRTDPTNPIPAPKG